MDNSTSTKETYWSKFANDFEERNNYVIGLDNMNKIQELLSKEVNLGRVLELGCGNGTYTKIIAPNSMQIIATDYSDEMVESTKSRLRNIQNVIIQKENCFSVSFEDNSFDTVFMANLLHIIPNPQKALSECYRVLKRGGNLIILSYTQEGVNFFNKIKLIYKYLKTYGKPPSTAYNLTREKGKSMLELQSFQVTECKLIGNSMKCIVLKGVK